MTLKQVRDQVFKLRARVVGRGAWMCPDCGNLNRMILAPTWRWLVRCGARNCHSSFRLGFVFYRQPPGNGGRPGDVVIGEAFPEAELSPRPYKARMDVHQLRGCSGMEEEEKTQPESTSESDLGGFEGRTGE